MRRDDVTRSNTCPRRARCAALPAIALVVAAVGAGCGGAEDGEPSLVWGDRDVRGSLVIPLTDRSGRAYGTATLKRLRDGTHVAVERPAAPRRAIGQVTVQKGGCDDIGSIVSIEATEDAGGATWVDLPLEELVEDDYVVKVHRPGDDYEQVAACGLIET